MDDTTQYSLTQRRDTLRQPIGDQTQRRKSDPAQAKNQCLAHLSQELRPSLNSILSFSLTLASAPPLNPRQRGPLWAIAHNGAHLLALLGDVLDLSQIEADGAILQTESFVLYGLLTHLEDMFRLQMNDKRLQLIFD